MQLPCTAAIETHGFGVIDSASSVCMLILGARAHCGSSDFVPIHETARSRDRRQFKLSAWIQFQPADNSNILLKASQADLDCA